MEQLSEDSVRPALEGMGAPYRFFESIGSTNTEAMEWARAGAPDGAVVVTAHQTQGRGRWGRTWASEPGKLLQLSVVLRPKLPLDRLGLITTALGVACAEAIERACGISTAIKWPNDVWIGGRKVAGILVETHVSGPAIDFAIAGIGINLGWSRAEIPAELSESATSIAIELDVDGKPVPPAPVLLLELLGRFRARYRALPDGAPELLSVATDRSEVLGREVVVSLSDETKIEGRALRLGPAGQLELETDDGLRTVSMGEVTQLR